MRHLVIILMLLLVSCGTTKNLTTQSEQREQTEQEKDIKQSESSTTDSYMERAMQRWLEEHFELKLTRTEFDTNKPIDDESGERPKTSETVVEVVKKNTTTEKEITNAGQTKTEESTLIDNSKEQRDAVTKERVKEKPLLRWWQKSLIAIGLFSLMSVVVWVIFKIKAR